MKRLIIVSNRLPFKYDSKNKEWIASDGGLVTALAGIKSQMPILWVGATTQEIPLENLKILEKTSSNKMTYSPLNISCDLYDSYYNGMCNDVLWPLLHYESQFCRQEEASWHSYVEVNQLFSEHIKILATEEDLIWVHDFHLFLLPGFLKKVRPNFKIGFFLHVPFPSEEIFRNFPKRAYLLQQLLKADLIGFHDYSYLLHFTAAVNLILGLQSTPFGVEFNQHHTSLGVFPVSIETNKLIKAASSQRTLNLLKSLREKRPYPQLILGVDRMDYIKGIDLKLKIFSHMLEKYPEMKGRVSLLQVAVPSRENVPEYIHLRNEIERLVGKINGDFGSLSYIPVQYLYSSVNHRELLALYRGADVLMITSKRDGMNLVSLEYIAAQDPLCPGVVLLSEFTGANSTLGHAVSINPWDIEESSKRLYHALKMPLEEKISRWQPMVEFLQSYTSTHWANSFVSELEKVCLKWSEDRPKILQGKLPYSKGKKAGSEWKDGEKRKIVLVLDYDGTMVPIADKPELAILDSKSKELFSKIFHHKNIEAVVVSGRERQFLKQQFTDMEISFATEHGAQFYDHQQRAWNELVGKNNCQEWLEIVCRIMESFTKRTPGSFIERKDYSVAWHYRKSPAEFAKLQACKLSMDLEMGLANLPVAVVLGKKVVEVRSIYASKGLFLEWFQKNRVGKEQKTFFVLGDDQTDEDMFACLGQDHITIKVGPGHTKAQYRLQDQRDVLPFLERKFL